MDEEGGEPIYVQARGFRMRRLPRYSPSIPFIPYPWHFPRNRTYKGDGQIQVVRAGSLKANPGDPGFPQDVAQGGMALGRIRVVPVDNFLIYKNIIRLDRPN